MTAQVHSRPKHGLRRSIPAGIQYFAVVFAIGFVLGTIRTIWLEPSFGTRTAELLEAPMMLVAIICGARWAVRRNRLSQSMELIATGAIAFTLLLVTEFTAILWLREMTFAEYVESRDPIAGGVYIVLLAAFGLMPLHCGRASYE
ncbi:MAG: hypothetical protein AB8G99_06380 [Planctomycetaceae bacterium]